MRTRKSNKTSGGAPLSRKGRAFVIGGKDLRPASRLAGQARFLDRSQQLHGRLSEYGRKTAGRQYPVVSLTRPWLPDPG